MSQRQAVKTPIIGGAVHLVNASALADSGTMAKLKKY